MMQRTSTASRRLSTLAAALTGMVLAACAQLPANDGPATGPADSAPPSTAAAAPAPQAEQTMVTVATVAMSCVPTKEAQAIGLNQTEQVQASYKRPAHDDAGDSSMELAFDGRTYTLRQAPSASGSRYVTSDTLASGHKGFSWHTKRNEAIISALESGSGVNNVVDGPLLYRCLAVN